MDEELQDLTDIVNSELCGILIPLAMAYKIPIRDLHPEILGVKYKEMLYNSLTEVPLVLGIDGMVIWLLPR